MPLRVAIVHYHLRPGGVTRVIENAAASLADVEIEIIVLTGESYNGRLSRVHTVEGLGYDDSSNIGQPRHLASNLMRAAKEGFGGNGPDLWHIHNNTLGKNTALPEALGILIRENQRMLFHVHDFAEDGRPDNYLSLTEAYGDGLGAALYPAAPQLHYAALNERDFGFLKKAGVPGAQLHLLPNPITTPEPDAASNECIQKLDTDHLFLYVTRAIRRKNIGEFVLWAALAGEDTLFVTTRAPKNPHWQPIHDRWVAFAGELGLPVKLALAEKPGYSLNSLMQAADALVTTSIAEGFGLAFLEPFASGKSLAGRNLPDITADFVSTGINLDTLYDRLDVPLEIIGGEYLRKTLSLALKRYYETYGNDLPAEAAESAFNAIVKDGRVDFGGLDESMQETVIKKAAESPDLRREIIPNQLKGATDASTITSNRNLIDTHYSLSAYRQKLTHIYQSITNAPLEKPGCLDARKLLDCFLAPDRFRLLRS